MATNLYGPDSPASLAYMNRRGAGVVKCGRAADLARLLPTLRREATLRIDGVEEPVGGIEECDNADDGRVRWQWWFDGSIDDSVKR